MQKLKVLMPDQSNIADKIEPLEEIANRIRATVIKMAFNAKETHVSSALSCVDILTGVYGSWIDRPWSREKRFILSKGHACASMYAAMAAFGWIDPKELSTYGVPGSRLPNHPCKMVFPEIEFSSGSLGQCLGVATGIIYANKLKKKDKTYVCILMGDGECNEGSVWEAVNFAVANRMSNLFIIVDNNNTQAVGRHDKITGYTKLENRFKEFGCAVMTIDGHNINEIITVLQCLPFSNNKPSVIIAKTISGYGVSFIEDKQFWFYRSPSETDLRNSLNEIKVPPLI